MQEIKAVKGITREEINEIFGEHHIKRIADPQGRPWIAIYLDVMSISGEQIEKLAKKGFKIDYINFDYKAITIDSIRGF